MPGTRSKGNLKVDNYIDSQGQYAQPIASPGSVYDQYFDADSDIKNDGPINRRLRNQSSLSQVMTYTDLMGSDTDAESDTAKANAVPITSFDSTADDISDDVDYDEESQAGARAEEYAKAAVKRKGRRQSIVDTKATPATKAKAAAGKLSKTVTPAPAIPQVDGEDEEGDAKTPPAYGKSEPTKESRDDVDEKESMDEGNESKEDDTAEEEGDGIFDYYDILNVEKDCPTEKIVEQYKKSIVMAEFERLTDDGKARIREVAEAYYVLADPSKRAMYDKCLADEDMSLLPKWKPSSPVDADALLSEVFSQELLKELFKPEFYFTPMSYVAGAVIGFILLSWPGLVVFAYLGGRIGDWEDNRPPPPRQLVAKLTDNQRTALMHALTRVVF